MDDSDIVRRALRAMLEHAGYCVTDYKSGREFLDSGLARPSDCILLDLEMPKPNGIEILDAMHDMGCRTPVIVVSGTHDRALLAGADRDMVTAIVKKPVGSDRLLAAIAEALSPSSRNG